MINAITGAALARSAIGFVGTPFRLHGRHRGTGVDCVGLLAASLQEMGVRALLPNGYALRSLQRPDDVFHARNLGLIPATGALLAGDILILQPGACQYHLAIALGPDQMVHAHAALRKVVVSPLELQWTCAARWRLPPEN